MKGVPRNPNGLTHPTPEQGGTQAGANQKKKTEATRRVYEAANRANSFFGSNGQPPRRLSTPKRHMCPAQSAKLRAVPQSHPRYDRAVRPIPTVQLLRGHSGSQTKAVADPQVVLAQNRVVMGPPARALLTLVRGKAWGPELVKQVACEAWTSGHA